MATQAQYQQYLQILANPNKIEKIVQLDFLNDDGTVAFVIDNEYKKGYGGNSSLSRAFLQDGSLDVSLQNGKRRQASVYFENLDRQFDFNVNHLWMGQKIRIKAGLVLPDGYKYYLPQGVFYINSPQLGWKPNSRKQNYTLIDKWGYVDGTLFGKLRDTYIVPVGNNIFQAMQAVLQTSKYTLNATTNSLQMIDNITPLFTNYYNNRTTTSNGQVYLNTEVPYQITVEYGKNFSDILLALNDLIAGWIGYDATGKMTVLPSENDIADQTKPIQWEFTTTSPTFLGLDETSDISQVFNEYTIVGEALDSTVAPVGRAINNDATSDTSIGRIGRKSQIESASGYYTKEQCAALAAFKLKRSTVLQKSVTFSSTPMFHLQENNLITVKRTDKSGAPIERHLIQSFSLPFSQTGQMSITATSVTDYPNITIEEVNYGIIS